MFTTIEDFGTSKFDFDNQTHERFLNGFNVLKNKNDEAWMLNDRLTFSFDAQK